MATFLCVLSLLSKILDPTQTQPKNIGTVSFPAGPTFPYRVNARKYTTTSSIADKIAPNKNPAQASLIAAAYATPTWKKHEAAVNSFKTFECNSNSDWPLSKDKLAEYVTWAIQERKLKASTVESYLSSLKSVHILRSLPTDSFDSPYLATLVRGAQNLEIYTTETKHTRKVMTLELVLWCPCTTAFFGSFRLGEILPKSEYNAHPSDTLLWKDINVISSDHVLIHVKVTKSRSKQGDYVDMFGFQGHGVCPVKTLLALKRLSVNNGPDCPVFSFNSGKNLTLNNLNDTVRKLLEVHLGSDSGQFSGHFRAAIPAVLAKYPEHSNSDEIMGWGRWKSEAYLLYTRLKADQRRKVFQKISTMLNSSSI